MLAIMCTVVNTMMLCCALPVLPTPPSIVPFHRKAPTTARGHYLVVQQYKVGVGANNQGPFAIADPKEAGRMERRGLERLDDGALGELNQVFHTRDHRHNAAC